MKVLISLIINHILLSQNLLNELMEENILQTTFWIRVSWNYITLLFHYLSHHKGDCAFQYSISQFRDYFYCMFSIFTSIHLIDKSIFRLLYSFFQSISHRYSFSICLQTSAETGSLPSCHVKVLKGSTRITQFFILEIWPRASLWDTWIHCGNLDRYNIE